MADPKAYLGNDPYIFVSYAHRNKDVVYPFIEALQEYYNVWFDDGIRYGREWEKEICSRIKNCTVFVYMITEESLASENCKDEIYMARDLGKSFLNVLVKKETKLPDEFTFRYGRFQMCNLYAFPGCAAAVLDLANKFEELGKTEKSGLQEKTEEGQFKKQEDIKYINDHFRFESRGNNTCAVFGKNKETLLPTLEIPSVSPTGEIVTEIGDYYAFNSCNSLTSVIIPDGVTSIGIDAFKNCTSLTSVIIPDSVTSIGIYAFENCTSLTSITIPKSVTSITGSAFCGCHSLTSVIVAAGNPIYHSAGNCIIETESKALIVGCKNSIIPDDGSVTSIERYAFSGRASLTSITIPDCVTSIGNSAFYDCTSLASFAIPKSVTSIGDNAFENCTALTSITIPDSVTSMGDVVFADCTSLTSVTISNSLTSIGESAFFNCTSLTSIAIPNSVTSIEKSAFSCCTALTSITIPKSVTNIESPAFSGCTSLTSITVAKGNPVYHSAGNCIIETESEVLIVGCKNSIIPDDGSVTGIGMYAFYDCTSLTSITIPDSVTSIDGEAFSCCTSLTSITIPDSVEFVDEAVFGCCTSLTSINVVEDNPVYHSAGNCIIETESEALIVGCKNSIIPDDGSVTSIERYAFYECSSLTSIAIPNSVTNIEAHAFDGCSALTRVFVPNSVTSIGFYAFYECSSLTSVIFQGTKAQWEDIEKEDEWDKKTNSYIIHCTDGDIKK